MNGRNSPDVLTDNDNVWNDVRVEAFDDNPNAVNELQSTDAKNLGADLNRFMAKEWAASIGIELPLNSDANVTKVACAGGDCFGQTRVSPATDWKRASQLDGSLNI